MSDLIKPHDGILDRNGVPVNQNPLSAPLSPWEKFCMDLVNLVWECTQTGKGGRMTVGGVETVTIDVYTDKSQVKKLDKAIQRGKIKVVDGGKKDNEKENNPKKETGRI